MAYFDGNDLDYIAKLNALVSGVGQFAFPAIQNASADPNTLDDYEEGTWTPTLTFATPGNLVVAYSTRSGWYTKLGELISIWWNIYTSTFTHSTASGNSQVSGLPFTASSASGFDSPGPLFWQGITKANYTNMVAEVLQSGSVVLIGASGSGQGVANITAGDMPTTGTVLHRGQLTYKA